MSPEFHFSGSPLVQLPQQFDANRLQWEIGRFRDRDWSDRPEGLPGNRAMVLVSAGGGANNDFAISGPMGETPALAQCPYLRQVLGAFECPISRTRLMLIEPGGSVPPHRDSGYHWYRRIRIHVPILTDPAVLFESGDHRVHMGAGESWCFDTRHTHGMTNGATSPCIHLVIDTRGSADIRRRIEAVSTDVSGDNEPRRYVPYRPGFGPDSYLEPYCFEVLTPEEFTGLAGDIRQGARADAPVAQKVDAALAAAGAEWQEIFLRSGHTARAEAEYYLVIERLRRALAEVELTDEALRALRVILTMLQTNNGVERRARRRARATKRAATWDEEARYQRPGRGEPDSKGPDVHAHPRVAAVIEAFHQPRTIAEAHGASDAEMSREQFAAAARSLHRVGLIEEDLSATVLKQPVFVVSTPRAGSTMLFEALQTSEDLWTSGHESHLLIEYATGLHPRDREWSSNRLTGADCSQRLKSLLTHRYARELRNRRGIHLTGLTTAERPPALRLLDKTPKNALRIPFLKGLFPDARFVYLYREPAANISSLIEGWRCGRFVTYPDLPDWPYWPWSFLLPPEWRRLRGAPPAEIAAYQWWSANTHIADDLAALPASSWMAVSYESLVRDPRATLQALFRFIDCPWGEAAEDYTGGPLPLSRTTLGAPHRDKWLKHEHVIRPMLASLAPLEARARELERRSS